MMSEQVAGYRKDRDAYGHEIYDFFKGEEVFEIIERDDGFIDAGNTVHSYFANFSDWPAHEQEGMRHLVPGRVLDLGCGAGRVELYLQSQGYDVVGIDNAPLAIEVCRLRGVKDARLMSVTQVRPELGLFDNIIMYGNNWGLMGSRGRARWLLRRFYKMTSPGAPIIAETNDIYQTDNPLHRTYQAYNRERGRMSGQIRLRVHHKVYHSTWFDYLMVSREEMRSILEGTGWRVKQFIDSDGSSYIAVIEKEHHT